MKHTLLEPLESRQLLNAEQGSADAQTTQSSQGVLASLIVPPIILGVLGIPVAAFGGCLYYTWQGITSNQ